MVEIASKQTEAEVDRSGLKNFKNLRISLDAQQQNASATTVQHELAACKCATYFNMENQLEHTPTCDNSPTTVRNASSDSCVYGTHYPNRIFVGHLPGKATATDLADYFRSYGTVLEGKVVLDSFGRSRRFGFVTFATHDDVQKVLQQGNIFFKGKKINVGPAVKKMFGAEPELTPPSSPTAQNRSEESTENNEEPKEAIITVPPVNERSEELDPSSPKIGNVWMKVSTKPKYIAKNLEKQLPTSPVVYPTQALPVSPSYVYPTYYTVPVTQQYNYPQYYYTQQSPMSPVSPLYPTQCTQQVMNYAQWQQINGYGPSLSVA